MKQNKSKILWSSGTPEVKIFQSLETNSDVYTFLYGHILWHKRRSTYSQFPVQYDAIIVIYGRIVFHKIGLWHNEGRIGCY